jgi:hypothetical protein
LKPAFFGSVKLVLFDGSMPSKSSRSLGSNGSDISKLVLELPQDLTPISYNVCCSMFGGGLRCNEDWGDVVQDIEAGGNVWNFLPSRTYKELRYARCTVQFSCM